MPGSGVLLGWLLLWWEPAETLLTHGRSGLFGKESPYTFPSEAKRLEDSLQKQRVRIAVVGNGPISEKDRRLIARAKEVYRFNSMNNLRIGEQVGTVFLRASPRSLSGIDDTHGQAACPLLEHAEGLRIIAGSTFPRSNLTELRQKYPSVEAVDHVTTSPAKVNNQWHSPEARCWTTGFLGVVYVLHHSPLVEQGAKIHIFGMNWNGKWDGHPWEQERRILTSSPQIVIHPAADHSYRPHAGLATCEGAYHFMRIASDKKAFVANRNGFLSVVDCNRTNSREGQASFRIQSNDDGSYSTYIMGNHSEHLYFASDGSLTTDTVKTAMFQLEGDDKLQWKIGQELYEMSTDH